MATTESTNPDPVCPMVIANPVNPCVSEIDERAEELGLPLWLVARTSEELRVSNQMFGMAEGMYIKIYHETGEPVTQIPNHLPEVTPISFDENGLILTTNEAKKWGIKPTSPALHELADGLSSMAGSIEDYVEKHGTDNPPSFLASLTQEQLDLVVDALETRKELGTDASPADYYRYRATKEGEQ